MDLSCRPNRLNERLGTYLMPGQEINETPAGDESADHASSHLKEEFKVLAHRCLTQIG